MAISVQTTNAISEQILYAGGNAICGALAASMLITPIGALGGAVFGTLFYAANQTIGKLTNKLFNTANSQATPTAKLVAIAIAFFGGFAAAWGLMALGGVTLTLAHVVALSFVTEAWTLPMVFLIKTFSRDLHVADFLRP